MNRLKIEVLVIPRIKNLGQAASSERRIGKTGKTENHNLLGADVPEAKSVTGAVLVEPFFTVVEEGLDAQCVLDVCNKNSEGGSNHWKYHSWVLPLGALPDSKSDEENYLVLPAGTRKE